MKLPAIGSQVICTVSFNQISDNEVFTVTSHYSITNDDEKQFFAESEFGKSYLFLVDVFEFVVLGNGNQPAYFQPHCELLELIKS